MALPNKLNNSARLIPMHLQQAASLTIERLISGRGSLATLMPGFYEKLPRAQHPKYKEICFGSCRWYYRLEALLNQLSDKPIKSSEHRVRAIIIVGLYQLMSMRTPSHAVVNEAVDSARRLNKPWARSLINAVLREFTRSGDKMVRQLLKEDSFKHAHQPWLVDNLQEQFPEDWLNIIKANNSHPPLCLRVNLRKIKRDSYLQMLSEKNIPAKAATISPAGVYLFQGMPVNQIPGFREGLVSVQDEAAQLAAYFLRPDKNARGLDACAAPGGKAGHLLEMEPSIQLLVLDNKEERLEKIKSNFKRLQVYANMQVADASDVSSWWDGRRFDFILLDAPCSASGVIRRNPDIRLLLSPEQVEQNSVLQKELLENLWGCLTDGGSLLYATCSLFGQENNDLIENFAAKRGDCVTERLTLDSSVPHKTYSSGIQLIPNCDGADGFFYSLLKKGD